MCILLLPLSEVVILVDIYFLKYGVRYFNFRIKWHGHSVLHLPQRCAHCNMYYNKNYILYLLAAVNIFIECYIYISMSRLHP